MMRGSIDASNRASVRDVVIPSIYGLQALGGKLKKEQLAVITAYEQKLQEIAENRVKEQKRLVAMAQKLRDQAEEICRQFDNVQIAQLRRSRFDLEVKLQAIQLNECALVQRQLQRQKALLQLQEQANLKSALLRLKDRFREFVEGLVARRETID